MCRINDEINSSNQSSSDLFRLHENLADMYCQLNCFASAVKHYKFQVCDFKTNCLQATFKDRSGVNRYLLINVQGLFLFLILHIYEQKDASSMLCNVD